MSNFEDDFRYFLTEELDYDEVNDLTFDKENNKWTSKRLSENFVKMINFAYKAWLSRNEQVVSYAQFIQEKLNQPILFKEGEEFKVRKLTGMREFNGEMVYTTNHMAYEFEKNMTTQERMNLKRINF